MTPGPRRRRTAAATLLLPVLLGACASGDDATDGPLVPAAAPDGWVAHGMGPVGLHAPGEWEALDVAPGDDSSEAYALRAPGEGAGTGVHTSVTDERRRDAAAAVANLRSVGDASVGARDVEEAAVTWPGARAAGWLGYEATVTVGGEQVDVRYEYLVLDLGDDTQAIVAVVAPADEFDGSGAHDVLASVTVG